MKGKYYLGLTGWFSRSHDASACIVKDGKILAMVEEERFTRKKHAYDKPPLYSTLWCLHKVGITLDDISCVGLGWDYNKLYKNAGIKEPALENLADIYFPKKYFKYNKKPKFKLIPHHLAHASCSYFLSGMKETAILVVDGQGEDSSTTFAIGRNGQIKIIKSFDIKNSLGYFYEAVSDFIGLGLDSAGKTMGLAPYGKPIYSFDNIKLTNDGYEVTLPIKYTMGSLDQQGAVVNAWINRFITMFGRPNAVSNQYDPVSIKTTRKVKLNKLQKDIACSAQSTLEKTLIHLVKILLKETGTNNLCLSGGVALNCSSNTKIADLPEVNNLFIPPITSDAGVSLGAALFLSSTINEEPLSSAYFGPTFSNSQIKDVLDKTKIKYKYYADIEKHTATLINASKIVSWFQGASEIGPRALGNRSIVANPTDKSMNKKVNLAKDREEWRPLAPSILEEKASKYFESCISSPFMLHTFNVKKQYRKNLPAIVHVDASTRPQTVSKKTNSRYYKLIKEFEKLSGFPIVLNTSFNGATEPIVCTPMDAILSFFSNSTDYLVIGNFVVSK